MSNEFFYFYSVDPDEMQHYDAFHLGLHCLPKQGSYRQIHVKFKDFQDFPTVFKD